jgi:molybdopterin molybdotransferase
LGASHIGLAAAVGESEIPVFRRPRVSIVPTGDEVIPFHRVPDWFQIRNSNASMLTAQIRTAGGIPVELGIAPDRADVLREMIERSFEADLLLLSGGVSAGKFDLVEDVLSGMGAEFFFQGVEIRPGKPLVFGSVRGMYFFGLPGNPVSTWVTFELFVRPAIEALAGGEFAAPIFLQARLAAPYRANTGLTTFIPARLWSDERGPMVEPIPWQGSGDLVGFARASCFIVIHPDRAELAEGDPVEVLRKD